MGTAHLSTSPRAIWQLTWPQMTMMLCFFGMGLCDVWTAGRIDGTVQAAFGLVSQYLMLLQVLVIAMSSGAMASISQSLGAGQARRARRYVCLTLALALAMGLGVALLAHVCRHGLFALVATPEAVLPVALSYWGVSLLTLPASYVFAAAGTVFRASREVMPPLYVAALMAMGNVFGNLGFGLGYFGLPNCGYLGIAWTTFTCTLLGAVGSCAILWRMGLLRHGDIPPWRWIRRGAPYLVKVALPAGAASLVWHSGYTVLFAIVASLPVDSVNALAGTTAGNRAEALLFLPGMAFNMTTAVMVGNCLGAGEPHKARRVALRIGLAGSAVMSLVAALLWPLIPWMGGVLAGNAAVHAITVEYLRYNFLATPFSLCSVIWGGAMSGAGATRYNLMVYGTTFWFVRLPLAWYLGHVLWRSAEGVFVAMLLSQMLQSSVMLVVLLKANWTRFAMHHRRTAHAAGRTHT